MSWSKNFQTKIELLRLVGWPAGFPFQMAGESISPDVKEPELLQFRLQSGSRDSSRRARQTVPANEDLLLREYP